MNGDERAEIAASVAASGELGPGYDAAVAEGLVERIGAEIDKRIDARLRSGGQPAQPSRPSPPPAPMPGQPMPGQPMPGQPMPGPMPGQPMPGQPMPGLAMHPYLMPQPMPPAPVPQQFPGQVPAHRGTGATIASVILALGSMGMGIGATGVIATHVNNPGFVIFLVWLAIVIINGMHARFYWRPDDHRRGRKG